MRCDGTTLPRQRQDETAIVCRYSTAGHWMHRSKLLSQRLSARNFDRQVVKDLQVRATILNGFTERGIRTTVAAA